MVEVTKSGAGSKVSTPKWRCDITVEPAYALCCLVETMMRFLYQNLMLQKYCHANTDREPDLESAKCDNEEAGFIFVANVNSWFLTPATVIACIYTMLAMSWSDKAGKRRKPLILIPLIGMLMETGSAALQSYFWSLSVYWTVFTNASAMLIFGGRVCFSQTVYLYITDITDQNNRSFRYGLLLTIRFLVLPLGYFVTGYMLRGLGFFNSFLACFVLTLMATFFSVVLIRDISEPVQQKLSFLSMINPNHALETLKFVIKKRPHNSRMIIAMMLAAYVLFSIANEGLNNFSYLILFG